MNFLAGTAQSPCAGEPTGWNAAYLSSAYSNGGPFVYPFAETTLAGVAAALGGCDFGDFASTFNIPSGWWVYDGSTTPPHGVFTPVGVNRSLRRLLGRSARRDGHDRGPPAPNVHLRAGGGVPRSGAIQIGSNNGATFQAPAGSPHNIVFMSMRTARRSRVDRRSTSATAPRTP